MLYAAACSELGASGLPDCLACEMPTVIELRPHCWTAPGLAVRGQGTCVLVQMCVRCLKATLMSY
jgi:hypothetical protein